MLRVKRWVDWAQANLFALPAIAVVVAYIAARWLPGVRVGSWAGQATVDSARAVLSVVAAATVTFASIALSVSLLVMQQGANQHSPRVLHGLMRDPFNRRVIAVVMATFTFCLVTLQGVRAPLVDSGEALVPQFSIALAVVLGLIAILAVIAMIHHTSQTIDVSVILQGIVNDARRTSKLQVTDALRAGRLDPDDESLGTVTQGCVRASSDGWVTSIDVAALFAAMPPSAVLRLETAPGRYLVKSMVVARISPEPAVDALGELTAAIDDAVSVGATRTSIQDPGFAVRQLVDVALRALSPGINDPTSALDAIFHLGTVLVTRFSEPEQPNLLIDNEGRRLELPHLASDADLVRDAVTELRTSAGENPAVYLYLLEMLHTVSEALPGDDRTRVQLLADEAALVMVSAERASLVPADVSRLRDAFERRFGKHRRTLEA